MGDRGNIVVRQSTGDIWLYCHWAGSVLPNVLQTALKRKQRWNDETYLTRIVFCEMLTAGGTSNVSGETGYGIGASLGDNEHDILVVDVAQQKVIRVPEMALVRSKTKGTVLPKDLTPFKSWTFEKFCALKKLPWTF